MSGLKHNFSETREALRSQALNTRQAIFDALNTLAHRVVDAQHKQVRGHRKQYPLSLSADSEAKRIELSANLKQHEEDERPRRLPYGAYWAIPATSKGLGYAGDASFSFGRVLTAFGDGRRASASHFGSPQAMLADRKKYFEGDVKGIHGIWKRTGDEISPSGYPRPHLNLMYRLEPRSSFEGITQARKLKKLKRLDKLATEVADADAIELGSKALDDAIQGN